MKKQFVVLMLCLLLAFSLAVTAGAEEPDGSFVLTVCTANNIVVEPVRVEYSAGQTIKEALLQSGHDFMGLEEHNFIDAIDGVVANYVFAYDNGGWNLEVPASDITVLRIGVTNLKSAYCEDMLSMIRRMAEYSEMGNHVQNYEAAVSAYKRCLNAIRGDGSAAAERQAELDNAIADYENILNGPTYSVAFTAMQGETHLTTPVITMTDSYGNVTQSVGESIQVIAGDYKFSVSDGSYNRTEGKIKVWSNTSVTVNLPVGEWFGEMYMRSYYYATGFSDPYRSTQDTAAHKTTIWVDDAAEGYYGTDMLVYIGNVPDEQTTLLRTIYVSVNGEDFSNQARSWSKSAGTYGNFLDDLVEAGMNGRTFQLEGQYTDERGHVQIQSYEIEVLRVPTLKKITVTADGTILPIGNEGVSQSGAQLPVGYESNKWDLNVTTVSDTLDYSGIPFREGYTVTGLGSYPVPAGESYHQITVTAENGAVGVYTVSVTKTSACTVTVSSPIGTDYEIRNAAGNVILPVNGGYQLIPGDEYTYITTKDGYYHTSGSFTASNGLAVTVAEPITEDWLLDLGLYSRAVATPESALEKNKPFSSEDHAYEYWWSDCNNNPYMKATSAGGTIYACYFGQAESVIGRERRVEIDREVGDSQTARPLAVFARTSGYSNTITVRIQREENGILYYQDYNLLVKRTLNLYDMTVSAEGEELLFQDVNGREVSFDRDVHTYNVTVNRDLDSISLTGFYPPGQQTVVDNQLPYHGGYYSIINGARYDEQKIYRYNNYYNIYQVDGFTLGDITIPLDTEQDTETVSIQICHADETARTSLYTLTVNKSDPVPVVFQTDPQDAVVFITNDFTGKRVFDENGVFMLTPGGSYTYTITRAGYKGVNSQYIVPAEGETLIMALEPAPENTELVNLSSEWPHLRQDNNNNGVVDYPTPVKSGEAVLYWATKLGDGFDSDACSPPILVDGYLYTYAGATLYKIDRMTGQIVASAAMADKSSFSINPPTYADGMIFVGLAGGRVQAFNAATMESLWLYHGGDGQPNCPIVYHNGYVYTGFWRGETTPANYVCISATDEDPSQSTERKYATWSCSYPGGFYWAGAYVCDDFVLVGTDDGETSYTKGHPALLSLDTKTGKVISEIILPETGDIRSSITCYGGKYYFTCKGGYFFEASVNGNGVIQNVRSLKLYNYASDAVNPPMSTSTPTIYNGRAYIGVSGTGQFGTYSGHNITVIDIANWEIAYTVQTKGYPQTSGVLTTAYEQETGSVYVYFFENFTPGILRVLEDRGGQVSPSLTTIERGHTAAYNLFQPVGDQAQYAICSPIMDSNGTMYFKNDSGYLMAIGSTLELEVVSEPEKLTYMAGEVFDSTGLQVMAHYANGLTRDVTEYLTWSTEPLTTDDTDFQLRYPIVMYQNVVEDGQVMAGVEYAEPLAVVTLTIEESQPAVVYGDLSGDGVVDLIDLRLVFRAISGNTELTEAQAIAADVNGDGVVDLLDNRLIFRKCSGQIAKFPVEEQYEDISNSNGEFSNNHQ